MKRIILAFTCTAALFAGGCITDNGKFPAPDANFTPKRTYVVSHDKLWQAMLDALDDNRIAVANSDKADGRIQTDYIAGPGGSEHRLVIGVEAPMSPLLSLAIRAVSNMMAGEPNQTISALGTTNYTVYDADSRPILTTDPNGITGTLTEYDAVGRMTNVIRYENVHVNVVPDPSAPGQWTTSIASYGTALSTNSTCYFANGWVKSRTSPDGTTTYSYYANGQTESVTDPLTNTTYYAYDTAGRQASITDALNHTSQFVYDAVGRQIETIFNDNTSVSNEFNNVGQRIGTVDQAGLTTQFTYNVAGSLTNVIKPSVPVGTPSWSYQYSTNGQLVATTDPKGHTTTNFYDALGRQLAQALPMGQMNTQAVYNARGRLWKEYDFKDQIVEHRYDNFGRQTNKYYFTAGATMPTYSVSYAYNQLNQLTNVTQLYGSTANSGYQPLARNGEDIAPVPFPTKLIAALDRSPNVFGGMTVMFILALGMANVPREKRRRLVWVFGAAWHANVAFLWRFSIPRRKSARCRMRPPLCSGVLLA